jgi:hypothetical protein
MKAYPIMYKHPTTGLIVEHEGLDARDWLAGMAMLGMLSENSGIRYPTNELVEFAYQVADAMMKQREVKNV